MLIEIPLSAIPNQSITTNVGQQQITVEVYQRDTGLFCNIHLGATLIIAGMKCNNSVYLNQYPTSLVGYLFFYTKSGRDFTYADLGNDAFLLYSDYDALNIVYTKWLKNN